MTRTKEALLAAVIAAPADDLPRLAYADFCEEHGDDAHAEFIRVQVELWSIWPGDVLPDMRESLEPSLPRRHRWIDLQRREREILGCEFFPSWCPRAIVDGVNTSRYRCGFVAEVTLPCAAWVRHGPALVRAAPLERVTLGGKKPYSPAWESLPPEVHPCWWWVCASRHNANRPEALPRPLFRALARLRREERRTGMGLGFADRAAALAALSAAGLSWARAAAVAAPPAAGV